MVQQVGSKGLVSAPNEKGTIGSMEAQDWEA